MVERLQTIHRSATAAGATDLTAAQRRDFDQTELDVRRLDVEITATEQREDLQRKEIAAVGTAVSADRGRSIHYG